mmetsp:Transcript_11221/g.32251  ORF Transcript_11221/g.32251 Transcript_11221/m.32251 type:complete len:263 (-) Transcript_11221:1162-1950(-)
MARCDQICVQECRGGQSYQIYAPHGAPRYCCSSTGVGHARRRRRRQHHRRRPPRPSRRGRLHLRRWRGPSNLGHGPRSPEWLHTALGRCCRQAETRGAMHGGTTDQPDPLCALNQEESGGDPSDPAHRGHPPSCCFFGNAGLRSHPPGHLPTPVAAANSGGPRRRRLPGRIHQSPQKHLQCVHQGCHGGAQDLRPNGSRVGACCPYEPARGHQVCCRRPLRPLWAGRQANGRPATRAIVPDDLDHVSQESPFGRGGREWRRH